MRIIDAHLDLSYNAFYGRDLTIPGDQRPRDAMGYAGLSLPEMQPLSLCLATIYLAPGESPPLGYHSVAEAKLAVAQHFDWYDERFQVDLRPLRTHGDLARLAEPGPPHAMLLLEGADAVRTEDDLRAMHARGLRAVGFAWKRTDHAGGTGEPGGLTALGRDCVRWMESLNMIHDASHLAEQAFWDLIDLNPTRLMASHSNCRALVDADRQLSDDMIKAIAERGGVIGLNFVFMQVVADRPTCTLADLVKHVDHIAQLTGSCEHVGVGSDIDGGFCRTMLPEEIRSIAHLPRVADALVDAGYGDADVANVMGENWIRFLDRALR